MDNFEYAITYVLQHEGGLVDNPHDKGGITNFGISLRFLRSMPDSTKYGFYGATWEPEDVQALTEEQAKKIYKGEFWDQAPFNAIVSPGVAAYMLDMAVNMGIGNSIKCTQRAIWAATKNKDILLDDGIMGSETIRLINNADILLLAPMRAERANYYRLLVERNPEQKEFLDGWLKRSYGG